MLKIFQNKKGKDYLNNYVNTVFIKKSSKLRSKRTIGLNWNVYGQTNPHIYSSKRINVDGVRMMNNLNKNQQSVIERLLEENHYVESVYLYISNNTDHYLIKTIDDYLDTVDLNDIISKIYWDLFDELPGYSFEFEPIPRKNFSKERLPSEAIKLEGTGGI